MSGMISHSPSPIYIDANPFIYVVEGRDALAAPIKALFASLRERPGLAVTSELTLAEVLPKAPCLLIVEFIQPHSLERNFRPKACQQSNSY